MEALDGAALVSLLQSISKSRVLEPGKTLRFTLDYCGKTAISGMLKNVIICCRLCVNFCGSGTGVKASGRFQ